MLDRLTELVDALLTVTDGAAPDMATVRGLLWTAQDIAKDAQTRAALDMAGSMPTADELGLAVH